MHRQVRCRSAYDAEFVKFPAPIGLSLSRKRYSEVIIQAPSPFLPASRPPKADKYQESSILNLSIQNPQSTIHNPKWSILSLDIRHLISVFCPQTSDIRYLSSVICSLSLVFGVSYFVVWIFVICLEFEICYLRFPI